MALLVVSRYLGAPSALSENHHGEIEGAPFILPPKATCFFLLGKKRCYLWLGP